MRHLRSVFFLALLVGLCAVLLYGAYDQVRREALALMSGFRDRWMLAALTVGLMAAAASWFLARVLRVLREQDRRKAAEQALKERELLLESLLKNLPVDFWARDTALRCIMQSDISVGLWGDLRHRPFTPHGQDAETLRTWGENNRRALAGETLRAEVDLTLPHGERRSFFNIVAPIRDQGAIVGILGVNLDITQRRKAEERIRASLQEKEILLKEIHHRVKNNLQIVSSLLTLQAGQVRDPEALALFAETRGRIMSMSLIHEELYRSSDLSRVDFEHYARNLADKLLAALAPGQDIAIHTRVERVSLPIDRAIPCGLILNELVTNALKHAFTGRTAGTILVSMSVSGGQAALCVQDDGRGLPSDLDIPSSPTLGMQLVVNLVEQLKGRLDIGSGPGASFTLTFSPE